jgi:hypothetical protein
MTCLQAGESKDKSFPCKIKPILPGQGIHPLHLKHLIAI